MKIPLISFGRRVLHAVFCQLGINLAILSAPSPVFQGTFLLPPPSTSIRKVFVGEGGIDRYQQHFTCSTTWIKDSGKEGGRNVQLRRFRLHDFVIISDLVIRSGHSRHLGPTWQATDHGHDQDVSMP